jgi:hypothetical protein
MKRSIKNPKLLTVKKIEILLSPLAKKAIIVGSVFIIKSCIIPVNLSFDSAKMIKKGDVEFQGNSSYYAEDEQYNFGAKVGLGVSDKYNVKIRYEAFTSASTYDGSYIEVENKIKLSSWAA